MEDHINSSNVNAEIITRTENKSSDPFKVQKEGEVGMHYQPKTKVCSITNLGQKKEVYCEDGLQAFLLAQMENRSEDKRARERAKEEENRTNCELFQQMAMLSQQQTAQMMQAQQQAQQQTTAQIMQMMVVMMGSIQGLALPNICNPVAPPTVALNQETHRHIGQRVEPHASTILLQTQFCDYL